MEARKGNFGVLCNKRLLKVFLQTFSSNNTHTYNVLQEIYIHTPVL